MVKRKKISIFPPDFAWTESRRAGNIQFSIKAGFTPVPESPRLQSGDEWKSIWGFRYGVSSLNPRKPRPSGRGGFTLIEMLVVGLVVGILGSIATISLISLLRGAAKTEAIKEIKQNGDYALSVIEVKLRNAASITSNCDGTTATSIQFSSSDSTRTEISCSSAAPSRIREQTPPGSTALFLTNTSVAADCSQFFSCSQDSLSGTTTVYINFTLSQANTEADISEQATQTFSTRVTLRNK